MRSGRKRAHRLLEAALWGVAFAVAAYLGWVAVDQQIHQRRQARDLREISRSMATPSPTVAPERTEPAAPPPTRPRPSRGETIGRLEIPRVGVSSFVAAGTDSLTMRRGVGHIDGTALPGEPGNVGLAGHRDTVFRGLRKIRGDDRIVLTTPDGAFEYTVESLRTVDPEQVEVLEASSYPTLTIVTCYPFDFVGPAPRRFVVRAREVGRPGVAARASSEPFEPGGNSAGAARLTPADRR